MHGAYPYETGMVGRYLVILFLVLEIRTRYNTSKRFRSRQVTKSKAPDSTFSSPRPLASNYVRPYLLSSS